jgi:Uma2 family endonuclease
MSTTLNETGSHLKLPVGGETRILIPGVRWSFYETFVDALPECSPVRLAYDGKDLEIMVTGSLHGDFADLLDAFFKAVARGLGLRFKPQGQTTWKRPEIKKGLESDRCYYIEPAKIAAALAARRAGSNDVEDYPDPDLAIEVDLSPPQADRAGIYASMRVAEVWTFDGSALTIRTLGEDGRYHVVEESSFLPLRAEQVVRWLLHEDSSDYTAWMDRVSAWARKSLKKRKR